MVRFGSPFSSFSSYEGVVGGVTTPHYMDVLRIEQLRIATNDDRQFNDVDGIGMLVAESQRVGIVRHQRTTWVPWCIMRKSFTDCGNHTCNADWPRPRVWPGPPTCGLHVRGSMQPAWGVWQSGWQSGNLAPGFWQRVQEKKHAKV